LKEINQEYQTNRRKLTKSTKPIEGNEPGVPNQSKEKNRVYQSTPVYQTNRRKLTRSTKHITGDEPGVPNQSKEMNQVTKPIEGNKPGVPNNQRNGREMFDGIIERRHQMIEGRHHQTIEGTGAK